MSQQMIRELEKHLAAGNIPAASHTIERIYALDEEFDAAEEADLAKLEAIYLSLVKIAISRPAGAR